MPRGGNTKDRGYGWADHRKPRLEAARVVNAGNGYCWRCGEWLDPNLPWDFGHDDTQSFHEGPECRSCNRSNAAIKGNRMRNQPSGTPSNAW